MVSEEPNGTATRSSGQRAPRTLRPGKVGEAEYAEQRAGLEVEARLAEQQRPALLRAAAQHGRKSRFGQPQRQRQMQGGVIGARTAERADQTSEVAPLAIAASTAISPSVLSLPAGNTWRGTSGHSAASCSEHRIEIAGPKLRNDAERGGMADAAVGSDDARAGDLRGDARRQRKISAKKDYETAHGDGLYHAAEPERKAGTRVLSSARLARRRPSSYLTAL